MIARQQMGSLARSLTPGAALLSEGMVVMAQRNAQAWVDLVGEFGALTSAQVSDFAGSQAHNRKALAARWRAEGRVFAVTRSGRAWYPGFQFGPDGQLRPVVGDVVRLLHPIMSDWEIALWFVGANGWLEGDRPVDRLDHDAEAVLGAATAEVVEVVF
ncbi:MAG: hypothetical protein ACYDH5_03285 [Acidimicrobiales bacterium]